MRNITNKIDEKNSNLLCNGKRKNAMQRYLTAIFIAVVFLSLLASNVNAQPTTCIPYATGVPALSGPPNWWDNTLQLPDYNNRTDDPRWKGAVSYTYGLGAADEKASFRALYDSQDSLYLSWIANVVPDINNQDNHAMYVGFSPGGSADDIIIKIVPFGSAANSLQAEPFFSNETYKYNKTTAKWESTNTPAWVGNFTRAWLKNTYPYTWAVQMKVPKSSNPDIGLDFGSTFHLWYEIEVDIGAGTENYSWPRDVYRIYNETTFQRDFPEPSTWGEFRLGSAGSACGTGISIDSNNIGTLNRDEFDNPSPNWIDINGVNTFFARPFNNMTTTIPNNGINARFRIANWGSQADWNDVPDPSLLWSDIRGGSAVTNSNSIPSGSFGNITFSWTLDAAEKADFQPGPGGIPPEKRPHQCMLVELSGAGLTFVRSSVYRNMDFVNASTFNREADVSVIGLPLMQSGNHTVYLYEVIKNMPEVVERSPLPPDRTIWDEESGSSLPFSWDSSNFEGFYVSGIGTETLSVIQEDLGAAEGKTRTIREAGLTYNTTKRLKQYEVSKNTNLSVRDALDSSGSQVENGTYYSRLNLFGEPYVTLNGDANYLFKLVMEQNESQEKVLSDGETWDIGDGWTLTAEDYQEPWLILKKDGILVKEDKVNEGEVYTFVDFVGIANEKMPLFVTYIDNVSIYPDPSEVRLKYSWAVSRNGFNVDEEISEIGIFMVRGQDANHFEAENYKEITLSSNKIIPLTDTLSFKVINDAEFLRFYPAVIKPLALEDMPTYQIYAYRDSGQRDIRQGVSYPIFDNSMTSFGHYVRVDEEEITGWKTFLQGATEVAPHLYKLEVPNNSTATVKTIIEAVEPGPDVTPEPTPPPCWPLPWWVWLLAVIIVVILFVIMRRRP